MPPNHPSESSPTSANTSPSLIALLREDDPAAWNRLVDDYSPMIFHWCRSMNLPVQEMPDVFQDVFHAIARNISRFRKNGPGDSFRGWLRTVTQNKIRDHYRRLGRGPRAAGGTDALARFSMLPATESRNGDESGTGSTLFGETLEEALSSIRPHFQERTWLAFWQVVIEGKSTAEVAAELSMQPGAIRVAKSRVLHRLRRELGGFA